MAFVALDQKLVLELLDYDPDTGSLIWRHREARHFRDGKRFVASAQCARWNMVHAGKSAGCMCNGYLFITIQHKQYWAHRVIWLWMTGRWPKEHIDHRDLNRSNNRWENLREATREDNIANRKVFASSKSGIKGIFATEYGTWGAHIRTPEGRKYLGSFKTKEEAGAAYAAAAEKHHGEFARTS